MENNNASPSKVFIERDRNGLFGLHVSNIPPDLNENDLRDLFYTSGYIKVCKIIKIADNSRVAFVKFATYTEAVTALKKCSKTKIGDHVLEVRPAYESQRVRNNRHNKDKSSSSESLSKQETRNEKSPGNLSNGIPTSESKRAEQRNEREIASKSTTQAPRTYILPASSQDVRFCNNGSSSSCESSNEPKTPVNPSTFNKSPTTKPKDTPKHTGIAASFEGVKKTESSHHTTQDKSALDASSKTKESPVTDLTKNLEKTNLDNSHKRGQYVQQLKTNTQHTNIDHSHQRNQHSQHSKKSIDMEHSKIPSNAHQARKQLNTTSSAHQTSQQSQSHSTSVSKWTVDEVAEYYKSQEECSAAMVAFIEEQEIDGNALMLIEESSLLYFMKLGPALKFLNLREKLKNQS